MEKILEIPQLVCWYRLAQLPTCLMLHEPMDTENHLSTYASKGASTSQWPRKQRDPKRCVTLSEIIGQFSPIMLILTGSCFPRIGAEYALYHSVLPWSNNHVNVNTICAKRQAQCTSSQIVPLWKWQWLLFKTTFRDCGLGVRFQWKVRWRWRSGMDVVVRDENNVGREAGGHLCPSELLARRVA